MRRLQFRIPRIPCSAYDSSESLGCTLELADLGHYCPSRRRSLAPKLAPILQSIQETWIAQGFLGTDRNSHHSGIAGHILGQRNMAK